MTAVDSRPLRSEPAPVTAISHVPALDGLRGVAILLVVTHHFGAVAGFAATNSWPGRLIERIFYAGWAGVDLFFVLSGFLISSVLLASRDRPGYFKNFYSRRALRILPLYYGTLILGLAVLPLAGPLPASFVGEAHGHSAWLWTYTTNIALALGWVSSFGVFDLYWTLAIEEQFYLVWPLVVRLAPPRTLAWIAAATVVGALVLRAWWIDSAGSWPAVYRFTFTRIDALALGALVALAVQSQRGRRRAVQAAPWILAAACAAFAFMFASINPFYPSANAVIVGGHSVLGVLFAAVVFVLVAMPGDRFTRLLSITALRWCGTISYGVYVWHWPFRLVLDRTYPVPAMAASAGVQWRHAAGFLLLGLAGSLLLGWLSYRFYEARFLRLKSRFRYDPPRR